MQPDPSFSYAAAASCNLSNACSLEVPIPNFIYWDGFLLADPRKPFSGCLFAARTMYNRFVLHFFTRKAKLFNQHPFYPFIMPLFLSLHGKNWPELCSTIDAAACMQR